LFGELAAPSPKPQAEEGTSEVILELVQPGYITQQPKVADWCLAVISKSARLLLMIVGGELEGG
jgi:hypothetical protein